MKRIVLLLFFISACGMDPEAPTAPPNILLILGDDHAAYALGAYGSDLARTPNLDRLASEGVRFVRAYANAPVCTASRQSFLTGQYPHRNGVTLLRTALSEEALTLADHLGGAGYATAAFGKMHFNSDLQHGFDELAYRQEHRAYLDQNPPPPPDPNVEMLGRWMPFRSPAREWLNAGYRPGSYLSGTDMDHAHQYEDMDGTFYAREAIRFLETERDEPFFLMASFSEPHSPFHFPVEMAGMYDPAEFPVPEVGPEDGPQIPLIFRDLTDAEKQGINAAYYTSVAYLDRNVGRVLDALEASGEAENTLVIYAGDHGYNLGHHGRFEKHVFYEEAVRVPFLIRWPGQVSAGAVEDALVALIDLFPTLSEAAGLPIPDDRQGHSLWPLIEGETESVRDTVFSLLFENEEAMLRTADWKFIYSSGARARQDGYQTDNPTPGRYAKLFDLQNDPGEFRNLANDPAHADRIAQFKQSLLNRFVTTSPPGVHPPAEASTVEDQLDWYLQPPETRGQMD